MSPVTKANLLSAADAAAADATQMLVDVLQIPTVNIRDNGPKFAIYREEVKNCFAYLEKWAKEKGFTWRNYEDLVCIAELPADPEFADSAKTIGALLHIDVVPAQADEWAHDPFSGVIEPDQSDADYIWGRGAQDDKGPTIAMMTAADIIRQSEMPRRNNLKLIIGSTEESTQWECMTHYVKVEPVPDFSIVPDAEFPVINGEKGFIVLYVDADLATSASGDSPALISIEAGQADNIIPGRCDFSIRLGGISADDAQGKVAAAVAQTDGTKLISAAEEEGVLNVRIEGKAAHASLPKEGANAAIAALDAIEALLGPDNPASKVAARITEGARDPHGAGMDIDREHEKLGRTSCALTILKGDASHIKAVINVRQPLGISAAEVFENGKRHFANSDGNKGASFVVDHKTPIRDPLYVDPEKYSDQFAALNSSYTDVTGREGGLTSIGGTTFAKAMANAVSFGGIDSGAGEASLIHQKDERVKVADHLRNVKIYTLALARLVGGNNNIA